MALLGPNNALAWAHFRLRGGWKKAGSVTVGAIVLISAVVGTSAYFYPHDQRPMFQWAESLFALQAIVLLMLVPGRIGAAIRQDTQSKMMESHRLMPMPPMHVIAGYIAGVATPVLIFSAGIFALNAFIAAAAGIDLPRYVFAHAILLAFAAFVWVVTTWTAFGPKLMPALMFAPLVFSYMSGGTMLSALPGVTVILSPVIGQSIFDLRGQGVTLPATYAIALAAQLLIGGLFFVAAARKYRSPESIGIDTTLGLLLLAAWVGVTFAALREWEDFRPRGWLPFDSPRNVRLITSLCFSIIVALGPVAANAWERVRWQRHERLHDPAPLRRPIVLPAVLAAATLLILAIPTALVAEVRYSGDVYARTGLVILITLLGFYCLFEWVYSAGVKAGTLAFIWLVLTWAVPVAGSLVRYGMSTTEVEPITGWATCSPAGALVVLWTRAPVPTTAGIALMALINAIPVTIWLAFRLRRRGRGLRQALPA
jgi:hypothetical protein